MEWFNGGVSEAIAAAKAKSAVFVVVVEGKEKDEAGLSLEALLADPEIVGLFSSMVCIRVENGSPTCQQFAAIYPVILIPSIYFIDSSTGLDLEVTGGNLSKEMLLSSFNKVSGPRDRSNKEAKPSEPAPEAATSSTVQVEAVAGASASLQERVEKAKMMVEQRRQEKAQAEEEKEKSKEMERRELGKAMLEMKRSKEEKELRDAAMQRRKDKEEDKKALERVRAQMEQDKLDKKRKYEAEKAAESEARAEREKEALRVAAEEAQQLAADRASTARIQLRLPDGSSRTHHFPAEAPLSDLFAFVRSDTAYTSFSLSTTFPRRNLDTEDKTTSLKDLQMAPSCTVMVLPTSTVSTQDGDLMSLLWLLLTPFTFLWGMISSMFDSSSSGSQHSSAPTSSSSRGESRVTRQGGIGRLRNSDFSDDENNTWNGNSTQQK